MQTFEEGKRCIVLTDADGDCLGVYWTLERAMDYVAGWLASVAGDYDEMFARIRKGLRAIETKTGWVIEAEEFSYKALNTTIRN